MAKKLAQNQIDFLTSFFEKAFLVFGFSLNDRPTLKDVKKRYRELAIIHHPDKGGNEDKMKEIISAYELFIGKTRLKLPAPRITQPFVWINVGYTTTCTASECW